MKEEKIIQYLKDYNFYGKENLYFYTLAPQNLSKEENYYGLAAINLIKYYLINKNENGIGVIPFDMTGKSMKDLVIFIPHSDIKEVYMEEYKFMFILPGKRLVIKTKEDKVIEIEYNGRKDGKGQLYNMYKFLSEYKKN